MGTSPLIQVEELASRLAGPEKDRLGVLDVRYRMTGATGCHPRVSPPRPTAQPAR